ncbi:MAG: alpha-glucosidase C-terminal domain-containing protein, partial [Bacteroidota bacterium]
VFGRGEIEWLKPDNGRILAFVRKYYEEKVLVIVNLSRHPQAVQLDLTEYEGSSVREVFGRTYFNDIGRDLYQITVGSHGYYWLQLESSTLTGKDTRDLATPHLVTDELKNFFSKGNLRTLEKKVLPAYLQVTGWMGARASQLETVRIYDHRLHTDDQRHFGWLLMEIDYLEGLPELIQLPLAFHKYREEIDYAGREEILGLVEVGDTNVVLLDALYDEEYRRGLVAGLRDYGELKGFEFKAHEKVHAAGPQDANLLHSGTEYMLLQSKDYTIKYYRRVDAGDVPDLEVKEMLTQRGYSNAPEVVGTLHFVPRKKMNATLAIFESRFDHEGTAWDYVQNNLQRFAEDVVTRSQQLNGGAPRAQPDEVSVTDEVVYRDMPDTIQDILGSTFVIKLAELGRTLAAYHTLMSEASDQKNFEREALSLHYQRSVYAGLKGDVRATVDLLTKFIPELDEETTGLAEAVIAQEPDLHERLKRIFRHKIEADKIRIHGDFTLEQVALSEDNFIIQNFDGDPDRSYSQRRLRRSPAKDIANLMRSLSYACGLVFEDLSSGLRDETSDQLEDWLRTANRYLSAEFMTAYRKATNGTRLLPDDEDDLGVLLDTFRIEKALQEIRYDLNYRQQQVKVPLRGVLELLEHEPPPSHPGEGSHVGVGH